MARISRNDRCVPPALFVAAAGAVSAEIVLLNQRAFLFPTDRCWAEDCPLALKVLYLSAVASAERANHQLTTEETVAEHGHRRSFVFAKSQNKTLWFKSRKICISNRK